MGMSLDEDGLSKPVKLLNWETLCYFMSDFVQDIRELDKDAAVVILIDEFTEIYQAIIRGHMGERFPARWTQLIGKSNVLCVTAGGEHTVSFSGVSNLTMKQFKNSKLTFSPAKNTYDDFARIVMRHLKVVVVYEDTPATFNLKSLNVNPNSITNCPNDTSKVTIELNNTSVTSDTTEVTISGSGIKNATISNINKKSNDTFTKDNSGNRIWKVNDKCKSRILSFNVSYTQPGNYQIKAKIKKNTGNTTEKETSIQVNSCKPVFDFEFTNSCKRLETKEKNARKRRFELNGDPNGNLGGEPNNPLKRLKKKMGFLGVF